LSFTFLHSLTEEDCCMTMNRRRFLRTALAGTAITALPASAAMLTPRQSAGPFYPDQPPLDDDSDLVQVAGRDDVARGQISELTGRLLDRNGRPLTGTRIEIWQCDANGRYRHSRDPGSAPIDPAFQGIGHAVSDASGRYRFRTIRPVPYPGRTPHIHVAVYPSGTRPFVTQLYVAGEDRNADDFLYRRIPVEQRERVTAAFEADGQGLLHAQWDVVLGVG
jgi:protocatechuate 3,4-dioxygenase beta subunit